MGRSMKFIAEHAFYGMLDPDLKIFSNSEIFRGMQHAVVHGDDIELYNYFRKGFVLDMVPIFVHTHPIGASYFSGTDDTTLYSLATMLSPKPILMQVVTESVILTKKALFEPEDVWKKRKAIEGKTPRKYEVEDWSDSKLFTEEIYMQNSNLYDKIRKKSYVNEKLSLQQAISNGFNNIYNRFMKRKM